jgi:Rrf2 family cysteine metabolism transcriptional repressor
VFGLNKKTDYGLELMIALAKNFGHGPFSLRQIAKAKKIPFKSLEQIAMPLRDAGLIEAKEGRGGGYYLTKKPKKISVAEVVEVLEGPVMLGACFNCPKAAGCGQKDVWTEVGDKVRQTIRNKTIKDLL